MEGKHKYTVEFSNSIDPLVKAGYQVSEYSPFDTLEDTKAFISREFEKAKALLLALPESDGFRFHEDLASKSIRYETYGSCHWKTIKLDEKGTRLIPTAFYPNEYVQKTYGIAEDGVYGVPEGMDIPYTGILFARSVEGSFKSYWRKDNDLPFNETLAKKLLDDPKVVVGTQFVYTMREEDASFVPATNYYLPCKNPGSSIFKPTVHAPVSDACNVDTDFVLEVLFAFDDGYIVPVTKRFETQGPFSICVRDAMHDILECLDCGVDGLKSFFEGCGNFKESEDGFILYGFSEYGQQCELKFDDTNYREVQRALSSIRLVELTERIITRKLNKFKVGLSL